MSISISKYMWWFLFSLMSVASSYAQTSPFYEDWRWVHFTTESGLPSDTILDVFETNTGVFWARTAKGLAWYDGFQWWPVGPKEGLPSGTVSSAQAGLDGDVLVVSEGRFYRDKNGVFKLVPVVLNGDTLDVGQVISRTKSQFLIFSDRETFVLEDGRVSKVSPLPQAALATKKRQVIRTRTGRIWSLSSVGLHEWVGGRWEAHIIGKGLGRIAEDASGNLVFTEQSPEQQGLWTWNKGEKPVFHGEVLEGLIVTGMSVAQQGDVVVGYASGKVEVRKNGVWHDLSPVPRRMQGMLCLQYGNNGDLWVGTDDGLLLFRGSSTRWRSIAPENAGPKELVIGEILRLKNGDIWAGTRAGIRVYKADGSIAHFDSVLGKSVASVTGMAEDLQGGIWISSGGGFTGAYRWDQNKWQHFGKADGLLASHYHRIVPDKQGRLWFLGLATLGVEDDADVEQGAFVYDGKTFTQWGPDQGLSHGRVYSFADGQDGDLWFGTMAGLSRWHNGHWRHWTSAQGLKEDRIFTMTMDQRGTVWFGHGFNFELGLGCIDDTGKPTYLTVGDGLINNQVFEIKNATDGSLWLGLYGGGVSRFKDGIFSSFGRDVGLRNLYLWPVLPLEDRVYVGTSAGIYQLNMDEDDNPPPRVDIVLPVIDLNRVMLRWHTQAYWCELAPENVQTRYKLNGSEWSPWSRSREVTYLDLDSGTHQFVVQAKSLFGNIDPNGTTLTFRIAPPLYQHPLFLSVLGVWGVSMVVLGVGYWRKQRRFLREIEDRNVVLEAEISERSIIEEKLRQSEEKFRHLVEYVPYGIVLVAKDGQIHLINAQTESLFGYRRDELLGQNIEILMPERFRETHRGHIGQYYNDLTQRPMGSDLSLWGRRKDGSEFPVEISLGPVTIEDEVLVLGIIVDVTDRERLQEQLRQSQKMEAIGNLAGGIAHDFNNLLTVINGYSQMLSLRTEEGPTRNLLDEITHAGERAGALTRQLLAFSRKQVLQPKLLDLNAVLTDTAKMLRRLIGEDIEFSVVYGAKGHIKADPSQLEQVFLNLVVNARDAMPQGGQLVIKTENEKVGSRFVRQNEEVPAGDYVVISVRDTGVGMNAETQSQIFEPFFTTKEVGKGTGLGLAMVYGIVKQSGGYIFVDSAVGKGATFKIYFNRIEDVADEVEESKAPEVSYGGTETILLVEDDNMVRDFTRQVLVLNGYRVLDAESGERAFELCNESGFDIALLLTDVVMPNLSGRQVAEQLQETYPNLKVLFMSGYTDDAIFQHGIINEEVAFIQKPFKPNDVLKKVREILDS